MTPSEKTYRAMLVAYPSEHRRVYGGPMIQLFRDRMRRDGGGLGTLVVWFQMGFDLAASAFKERMETIMVMKNWTSRWWETSVVLLGVNSVVFGFTAANSGFVGLSFLIGWVPAVLLLAGFGMRNRQRIPATVMLTVGSIGASFAFWVIYTIVLALVIVVGGLRSGKIGLRRAQPELAT